MNMEELISFEKAAENVVEVVTAFYARCMALNEENTVKFQNYIKVMPNEDASVFTDEFEIIKNSIGRLDELMTSIVGDEFKRLK